MGSCLSSPSKDAGSEKPSQPAARPSGAGLQRMSVASPVGRRQDLDAAENPSIKAEAGSVATASDVASATSSPTKPPAALAQNGGSNGTASQPADHGLRTDAGTSSSAAARQAKLANEELPEDISTGSSTGRKASAPMAVPGGARGRQSSDGGGGGGDCEGTSPKSDTHKGGSVPLLSRMSLTGLTKTSPGVGEYLRRHSTEGVRHKLDQVKRANQALTEKAHGKDESSTHAVAAIDPALYY